jgi:DNA polymerase III subunit gamma/tau
MPDSHDTENSLRDPDMADDALGLGLAPVAPQPVQTGQAYRVLARKYRPQTFAALIGQEAMVQTLGNAIKRDRLAHAFLMTGVRGVGKTTTARLIAKALNCIGADGQGGPTISPCDTCEPCIAIAEGRHIDVIEMDAASHTGIDDIREITEAVRYSAVSARYKIYIIDEVHMLSKQAFNGLLKTLEEPPAHVKFLFATTEVNKVPITVLSRCQRFDLKRIEVAELVSHFTQILGLEAVSAEEEAVHLIAQAAEGSVRDGLSILDQAIAHADIDGDGKVTAGQVREMLGLSDSSAMRRLLKLLLACDAQAVLAEARNQYALGVEPLAIQSGLLSEIHLLTLAKVGAPFDRVIDAQAQAKITETSEQLTFPILHRVWQLLLKGHDEVRSAAMPREANDMALLRIVHVASMPDPGELARMLQNGVVTTAAPTSTSTSATDAPTPATSSDDIHTASRMPSDFPALLKLLTQNNYLSLESTLRDVMRVVDYAPPVLTYQLAGVVGQSFVADLRDALHKITGERWDILEAEGEAAPSLLEIERAEADAAQKAILGSPLVKAAFEAFPDAELLKSDEDETIRSASA